MYCNNCRAEFSKREDFPFRGIAAKLCGVCLKLHHKNKFTFNNKEYYCISCGDILEKFNKNIGKVSRIRCNKCLTRTDVYALVAQNEHLVNIIHECACIVSKKIRHHFDYSRPYDVMLLCLVCHSAEHYENRSGKPIKNWWKERRV